MARGFLNSTDPCLTCLDQSRVSICFLVKIVGCPYVSLLSCRVSICFHVKIVGCPYVSLLKL